MIQHTEELSRWQTQEMYLFSFWYGVVFFSGMERCREGTVLGAEREDKIKVVTFQI